MEHAIVVGKYTLESLTNGMYSSPMDLYREYIQNSVDSFDNLLLHKSYNSDKLRIDIIIDKVNRRISIKDNGYGIQEHIAVSTLLDIGNSQKSRNNFRGFRGIGRLAGLGYCEKLIFKTSFEGENTCTVITFDSKLLNELLIPGNSENDSVNSVLEKVVSVTHVQESITKSFFEVILEGVSSDDRLLEGNAVKEYLMQHAPLSFDPAFKWQRTIVEKMRLNGYDIPRYHLYLNGEELFKPYQDIFISDRVKKNEDKVNDIEIEIFKRNEKISAILWYAKSDYYGTVLDNLIKGIRIRQGNILLGDKSSFNQFFKEERFNGWLIGELHVVDEELIANARRDGFEKNKAFYELSELLKNWANFISKEIRRVSYERSLSVEKKVIAEADTFEDVNDLCSEIIDYDDNYGECSELDQSESDEVAETDFIGKLTMFLNQKNVQTKYKALNVNTKLTGEQRKVLERVFDVLTQEYSTKKANEIINTIIGNF